MLRSVVCETMRVRSNGPLWFVKRGMDKNNYTCPGWKPGAFAVVNECSWQRFENTCSKNGLSRFSMRIVCVLFQCFIFEASLFVEFVACHSHRNTYCRCFVFSIFFIVFTGMFSFAVFVYGAILNCSWSEFSLRASLCSIVGFKSLSPVPCHRRCGHHHIKIWRRHHQQHHHLLMRSCPCI